MKSKSKNKFKYAIVITLAIIVCLLTFFSLKSTSKSEPEMLSNSVIPKPISYQKNTGEFIVTENTEIFVKGNSKDETEELYRLAEYLSSKLSPATGYNFKINRSDKVSEGSIYLTTIDSDELQGDEGYRIDITERIAKVSAYKTEGIFRGLQTFRQLLPAAIEKNELASDVKWNMECVVIEDKPEYEYRSLMIDVARNFFSVDEIKRQIDIAAGYKINKLHLHLSDDQGWRLEIEKWPELARIGGAKAINGGQGGYYTKEEFKDLVKYAQDRYIEIIPEFDMPGHTTAMLSSYDFLNPSGKKSAPYYGMEVGISSLMCHDEKTYEVIEDIIKEVSEISPSKYIHIGGDEAHKTSKEDYNYFMKRVSEIALKYGKTPIGWNPIDTVDKIDNKTVVQLWKGDASSNIIENDMKMIVSKASKSYLDMKYDYYTPYGLMWAGCSTVQDAYEWDPQDYAPRDLILGVESCLFTETITGRKSMDYMIYPRLLGHAEVGWSKKESRDFNEYKNRLKYHGYRLENMGVSYYKDKDIW